MWFSKHVLWKVDPVVHRLTGHRFGMAPGLPTAILETIGAHTGQPRRKSVIYFHDGDRVTIVASKFGYPENPSWYHNLRAHPDVRLNGAPYRAVIVEDATERQRLWDLADRVLPAFKVYRERAAASGRTIPIVQLISQT